MGNLKNTEEKREAPIRNAEKENHQGSQSQRSKGLNAGERVENSYRTRASVCQRASANTEKRREKRGMEKKRVF
jgi:hypothetical protein